MSEWRNPSLTCSAACQSCFQLNISEETQVAMSEGHNSSLTFSVTCQSFFWVNIWANTDVAIWEWKNLSGTYRVTLIPSVAWDSAWNPSRVSNSLPPAPSENLWNISDTCRGGSISKVFLADMQQEAEAHCNLPPAQTQRCFRDLPCRAQTDKRHLWRMHLSVKFWWTCTRRLAADQRHLWHMLFAIKSQWKWIQRQ